MRVDIRSRDEGAKDACLLLARRDLGGPLCSSGLSYGLWSGPLFPAPGGRAEGSLQMGATGHSRDSWTLTPRLPMTEETLVDILTSRQNWPPPSQASCL